MLSNRTLGQSFQLQSLCREKVCAVLNSCGSFAISKNGANNSILGVLKIESSITRLN